MKTTFCITVAAILAGIATAQDTLPSCAQSCVTQYTSGSNIGGCASLDIQCICSSSTFISGIACCLAGSCDTTDQASAVAYAQNICKTAGVTVPDAVSCISSSTTATATSSSASAASSAASSVSSSTSSVTASATSRAGSSTSSTSSSATATGTSNAGNMVGVGSGMFGLAAALVLL